MTFRRIQVVAGAFASLAMSSLVLALVSPWDDIFFPVAAVLALAAVAIAWFGVRGLRARIAVTERRYRDMERRLDDVVTRLNLLPSATAVRDADRRTAHLDARCEADERAITQMAGALLLAQRRDATRDDQALEPAAPFVPDDELVVRVVDLRLASGDVLEAARLLEEHLPVPPLRLLRQTARGLRDRGYLVRAQRLFEAAAAVGTERDARDRDLRQSELDVLSGRFTPVVRDVGVVKSEPGRVLHVVGRAVPTTQSGYTLRTHSTARAQLDLGLDAHVFVQQGITDQDVDRVDVVDGVTYHRPAGASIFEAGHAAWLQQNADRLLETALEVRPAVLHAHSDFLNGLLAECVGAVTGIPVVYESRGFWEESWLSRISDRFAWADPTAVFERHGVPESYSWRRAREAEVRSRADHVVTLARVMRSRIAEDGLDPQHVTIVPNAVDVGRFATGGVQSAAPDLGIAPGAVVFGCITSVVEYEGLDLLVEAFARVSDTSAQPVWLVIVGDGPVLDHLRRQTASLELSNVSFPGRVPHADVQRYYSAMDVFVVPRRPAAVCHLVTPLKPFEAFAAGRALVLSDVAALREIAEDSNAARLFASGDVDDLASVMLDLAQSPEDRNSLARAGRSWVEVARSWSTNALSYGEVYARARSARGATELGDEVKP